MPKTATRPSTSNSNIDAESAINVLQTAKDSLITLIKDIAQAMSTGTATIAQMGQFGSSVGQLGAVNSAIAGVQNSVIQKSPINTSSIMNAIGDVNMLSGTSVSARRISNPGAAMDALNEAVGGFSPSQMVGAASQINSGKYYLQNGALTGSQVVQNAINSAIPSYSGGGGGVNTFLGGAAAMGLAAGGTSGTSGSSGSSSQLNNIVSSFNKYNQQQLDVLKSMYSKAPSGGLSNIRNSVSISDPFPLNPTGMVNGGGQAPAKGGLPSFGGGTTPSIGPGYGLIEEGAGVGLLASAIPLITKTLIGAATVTGSMVFSDFHRFAQTTGIEQNAYEKGLFGLEGAKAAGEYKTSSEQKWIKNIAFISSEKEKFINEEGGAMKSTERFLRDSVAGIKQFMGLESDKNISETQEFEKIKQNFDRNIILSQGWQIRDPVINRIEALGGKWSSDTDVLGQLIAQKMFRGLGLKAGQSAQDLMTNNNLQEQFGSDSILAGEKAIKLLAFKPGFSRIRNAMSKGDMTAAASFAGSAYAGTGDLQGIENLRGIGMGEKDLEKFQHLANVTLNNQEKMMTTGYAADTAQARFSGAVTRGEDISKAGGNLKKAFEDIIAVLKDQYANLKAAGAENTPEGRKIASQIAVGQENVKGADYSTMALRNEKLKSIYTAKYAGLETSQLWANLYGSGEEIGRVAGGEISATNDLISQREAQNVQLRKEGKNANNSKLYRDNQIEIASLRQRNIVTHVQSVMLESGRKQMPLIAAGAEAQTNLQSSILYNKNFDIKGSINGVAIPSVESDRQIASKNIDAQIALLQGRAGNVTKEQAYQDTLQIQSLKQSQMQMDVQVRGVGLGREKNEYSITAAESSIALQRGELGTASVYRSSISRKIEQNNARVDEIEKQRQKGNLTVEQEQSLRNERAQLNSESFNLANRSIDVAYNKEDLAGFGMASMRMNNLIQRAKVLPYGPGNIMGLTLAQARMNTMRITQVSGRENELQARGLLSPERKFAMESEKESLTTQNYEALGSLTEGIENRLPALSAGAPSGFRRFTSIQMAAIALGNSGSPMRSFGAMGGRQENMQNAFINSFGLGNLDPKSRTEGLNNNIASNKEIQGTLEKIANILAAINNKTSNSGAGFTPRKRDVGDLQPTGGGPQSGHNVNFN